ncbi:hypothetical protein F383_15443 [Gossypium arboreum]|uniref:Uncharacterized protein n=1 Tax=Gossypium arboreum TaxID=29729 RepID=A0A0B0NG07_GOSAR|nr:hypothetical protein F383_15443 [Gossypium arboreum]
MFTLVTCIICIIYQIANLPYFQIGNQLTHTLLFELVLHIRSQLIIAR